MVDDFREAVDVLTRIPGVTSVQLFGERAHVRVDDPDAVAADRLTAALVAAGLTVSSLRESRRRSRTSSSHDWHKHAHERRSLTSDCVYWSRQLSLRRTTLVGAAAARLDAGRRIRRGLETSHRLAEAVAR